MQQHFLTIQDDVHGSRALAYYQWGDINQPVLVCVHGLTRNAKDFVHLAEALAPDYCVIAVDIAGRGQSDWLQDPTAYHYGTYVTDVQTLLDHLQVQSVDFVGTSMGGLIGMMVAAMAPQRIGKLVMNDVGPFIPGASLMRIRKYVSITPIFQDLAAAEGHLRTILAPFGIKEEAHWQHIITHSLSRHEDGRYALAYDPAIGHSLGQEETLPDVDLWHIWEAVSCPTLIIRGADSDVLLPHTAKQMQKKPYVSLIEFPNIGHAPALMEQSQLEQVQKWLTE